MTDLETIDGEVQEIVGQALEVAAPAPVNLFDTRDPVEVIQRASETATVLADVLRQQKLTSRISNREHVRVEGWTLLGTMLGVFPVCTWTRKLEDGWEARVEARTLAGAVVGAAEAECLRSEKTWASRDDYALRSMAQTRATSKALRQPLGFVVTLAGFDPTPLEEMPSGGPQEPVRRVDGPDPLNVPRSWQKVTEMIAAYPAEEDAENGTHATFFRYADASRRYLYPGTVDTKSLSADEKKELLRVAAGAAVALREAVDASAFPPPSEDDIRKAFASVLEGVELTAGVSDAD